MWSGSPTASCTSYEASRVTFLSGRPLPYRPLYKRVSEGTESLSCHRLGYGRRFFQPSDFLSAHVLEQRPIHLKGKHMLAVLTVYAPGAVLTVWGIIYCSVLFGWWLRRGISAWCGILLLAPVGAIVVGLASPDPLKINPRDPSAFDTMINYKGEWVVERDLLRANIFYDFEQEGVYRGTIEGWWGRIFHPAAFWWCPLFVAAAAIPLWPILRVPILGYSGLSD